MSALIDVAWMCDCRISGLVLLTRNTYDVFNEDKVRLVTARRVLKKHMLFLQKEKVCSCTCWKNMSCLRVQEDSLRLVQEKTLEIQVLHKNKTSLLVQDCRQRTLR